MLEYSICAVVSAHVAWVTQLLSSTLNQHYATRYATTAHILAPRRFPDPSSRKSFKIGRLVSCHAFAIPADVAHFLPSNLPPTNALTHWCGMLLMHLTWFCS